MIAGSRCLKDSYSLQRGIGAIPARDGVFQLARSIAADRDVLELLCCADAALHLTLVIWRHNM
jgi:hypothetical protein